MDYMNVERKKKKKKSGSSFRTTPRTTTTTTTVKQTIRGKDLPMFAAMRMDNHHIMDGDNRVFQPVCERTTDGAIANANQDMGMCSSIVLHDKEDGSLPSTRHFAHIKSGTNTFTTVNYGNESMVEGENDSEDDDEDDDDVFFVDSGDEENDREDMDDEGEARGDERQLSLSRMRRKRRRRRRERKSVVATTQTMVFERRPSTHHSFDTGGSKSNDGYGDESTRWIKRAKHMGSTSNGLSLLESPIQNNDNASGKHQAEEDVKKEEKEQDEEEDADDCDADHEIVAVVTTTTTTTFRPLQQKPDKQKRQESGEVMRVLRTDSSDTSDESDETDNEEVMAIMSQCMSQNIEEHLTQQLSQSLSQQVNIQPHILNEESEFEGSVDEKGEEYAGEENDGHYDNNDVGDNDEDMEAIEAIQHEKHATMVHVDETMNNNLNRSESSNQYIGFDDIEMQPSTSNPFGEDQPIAAFYWNTYGPHVKEPFVGFAGISQRLLRRQQYRHRMKNEESLENGNEKREGGYPIIIVPTLLSTETQKQIETQEEEHPHKVLLESSCNAFSLCQPSTETSKQQSQSATAPSISTAPSVSTATTTASHIVFPTSPSPSVSCRPCPECNPSNLPGLGFVREVPGRVFANVCDDCLPVSDDFYDRMRAEGPPSIKKQHYDAKMLVRKVIAQQMMKQGGNKKGRYDMQAFQHRINMRE
eukprot:m.45855 g.45855  ORF g.45855 m.45855 type:complete len:700 (-) comp7237_c1_seq4:383-2482(-)